MVRNFRVQIDYFKPSGKWYTSTTVDRSCRACGEPGSPGEAVAYTNDLVAWLRGLRDTGSTLPGLADPPPRSSEPGFYEPSWPGPILVRVVGYYDTLTKLPESPSEKPETVESYIPSEQTPALLLPRGS